MTNPQPGGRRVTPVLFHNAVTCLIDGYGGSLSELSEQTAAVQRQLQEERRKHQVTSMENAALKRQLEASKAATAKANADLVEMQKLAKALEEERTRLSLELLKQQNYPDGPAAS